MSLFDPGDFRHSQQHTSTTITNQSQPKIRKKESAIPLEHVTEQQKPSRSSVPENETKRQSVAPIRSLSTRQNPRYSSSSSDLTGAGTIRAEANQRIRSTPSGTILRTIEKLEGLLGELDRMTAETEETETPTADPPIFQDGSTRISLGIRKRAESLPLKPRGLDPELPKESLRSSDRRVTFREDESTKPQSAQKDHELNYIRACEPIHFKYGTYKADLAPAEVTRHSQDFVLKLVRRRSQSESRFREDFTLNPPPSAAVLPGEGDQDLNPKRTSRTRVTMSRKNYKQRVRDNQPPPILPRTTSVRDPNHGNNGEDPPSAGSSSDLKKLEPPPLPGHERHYTQVFGVNSRDMSIKLGHPPTSSTPRVDLRRHRHVDVPGSPRGYDLHQTCHHAPVARDWPVSRKRFTAIVACLNAACIGVVIGVYSGEVPAIQYVLVDFHHFTILGNVFLYCAMAIPTLFFWPLPLLHGRKVYTVSGITVAMCLQVPQAVAVSDYRSPDVASYRQVLFLSRALSGFAFGFVMMNIHGALLDCFGASLQSHSPHGETLDPYDVRRHGGGMGLWLGLWSFASLASVSLGFMIGAFIINVANVMWGFWTCFMLLLALLLINIITPEVRRSAYRRTLKEMRGKDGDFSRVARGEVKMHLGSTGPFWWGEEVLAGIRLSARMVRQPGFMILAIYIAWVYAQFTMILMLLGALASRYYMFKPIHVGLCVLALTLGALLAVPFEKASWLSRSRYRPPRTDSMTLQKGITWSSHMLRRVLFTTLLPVAALASTLTSKGPPLSVAIPCFFAAMVGFLSTLAIAECFGLIMETFDTSDLQPGMTGRPFRRSMTAKHAEKRTNFSCYPRVSAGLAITQSIMFVFAATATGMCGRLERKLGAMVATACVAAGLLFLTLLLTLALTRVETVKMIPDPKPQLSAEDKWKPVQLGAPNGTMRRISLLEAGRLTRWSTIRRRNQVDEEGLTGS